MYDSKQLREGELLCANLNLSDLDTYMPHLFCTFAIVEESCCFGNDGKGVSFLPALRVGVINQSGVLFLLLHLLFFQFRGL